MRFLLMKDKSEAKPASGELRGRSKADSKSVVFLFSLLPDVRGYCCVLRYVMMWNPLEFSLEVGILYTLQMVSSEENLKRSLRIIFTFS